MIKSTTLILGSISILLLSGCNRLVPAPGGVEMITEPCYLPVQDQRHLSYYYPKTHPQ